MDRDPSDLSGVEDSIYTGLRRIDQKYEEHMGWYKHAVGALIANSKELSQEALPPEEGGNFNTCKFSATTWRIRRFGGSATR